MNPKRLHGVIAAIATAVDRNGAPDISRSLALARYLLANGCDGLNVLGTTGEATSFSTEQRKAVMSAYRDAGLPVERLMVGTGAAIGSRPKEEKPDLPGAGEGPKLCAPAPPAALL